VPSKGANWNLGDAADAIAAGFTALRALQRHLNGIFRKPAEKFHALASSFAQPLPRCCDE
jgi:hypothetical protein